MSDVSTFVKRGQNDHEAINKLQALITPIAFPEPEESSQKERIILSSPVRERVLTSSTGTDITDVSTATRDRLSSSITLVPDTTTVTAFPVSETLTGTLTYNQGKNGAGATFTGSQYITIPDDNQFDLSLPYFTMAFWFKADGTNEGTQTVWSKGSFGFDRDYCLACGDFDTDDYSTVVDIPATAGLEVRLQANTAEDHCSACTDFDSSYDTSASSEEVRVIISDGTNLVDEVVTAANLFDGNWHSIVIVSDDTVEDYCSACTDWNTDDYYVPGSPVITVYMDKVSLGTIDHSSITGDLSNSADAYLGAESTSLEYPLIGSLALFEYQASNWETADIDAYNDDARIKVTGQKAAFHFIGNDDSEDTLATIYQ